MIISDRVMLIGSGWTGANTSHPLDCNVYLVDGGSEYAIMDSGAGVDPQRIIANMEHAGVELSKVTHLLLTHAHGDHAAGARYLRDTLGVKVVCSAEAQNWIETADEEKTSIRAAKQAGIYPADFKYPPCRIDHTVVDNDQLIIGNAVLQVLETPGHSRGHVCYAWKHNESLHLFSGDTVFSGGRISLLATWDSSIQDYAFTVNKLHGLGVDKLFPGHGTYQLNDGWKPIENARKSFQSLTVPPNL